MAVTSELKTVRAFISSTFRDMHAERDHLVTIVFPELRERLERLGLEFFDVDLRWGVPEKDANGETANSWEYCKKWIERVEPFFIGLLGQRYGFVPSPQQIYDHADRQHYAGLSITEMEIRHAVLMGQLKRRSYFYLRKERVPATATADVRAIFVKDEEKVADLKRQIRAGSRPVYDYRCRWTGNGFVDLDDFGHRVLEDLWSGVLRDERYVSKEIWRQVLQSEPTADTRYTDESQPVSEELWQQIVVAAKPKPKNPLDAEREQMEAVAQARLRWFQGRTKELQQLGSLIHATDGKSPRLAVVVSAPGQGKSALLARLSETIRQEAASKQDPPFIITHFVGATERSASAHALVERLLDELDQSGIAWREDKRQEGGERDFNSLCNRLANRLRNPAGGRRIVILLDALNQLTDGHDLTWLPPELGQSVRMVVSCVKDPTTVADSPERKVREALASRQPAPLWLSLGELSPASIRAVVVDYLREYCHELDSRHLDILCAIPQASNPLYLLVMLNELRTLGGDDLNRHVPRLIAEMPLVYRDTVSLFRWVLQRLEVFNENAADAVKWWCLYLAHARAGMSSRELADLLARKLGPNGAAASLRIERGLRRYLQRRGAQLDFFHSQLRQAALDQYGSQAAGLMAHSDIAEYFGEQDYFLSSVIARRPESMLARASRRPNVRKLQELPWQRLTVAKMSAEWGAVEELLTDLRFLQAKAGAGMIFELADDFQQAVQHMPRTRNGHHVMEVFGNILGREAQVLHDHLGEHPQLLFQNLWNRGCLQVAASVRANNAPENGASIVKILDRWRSQFEGRDFGYGWIRLLGPVTGSGDRTGIRSVLTGHQSFISALRVDREGRICVSASHERNLLVWDLQQNRQLRQLVGHRGEVADVAMTPDGRTAVSVAKDLSVYFWHVASSLSTCSKKVDGSTPDKVAITPDGKTAITISDREYFIRVWHMDGRRDDVCQLPVARDVQKDFSPFQGRWTESVVIDPLGGYAAISIHGIVTLFNLATRTFIPVLPVPCEAITFTPDGATLFCVTADAIHVCDCSTMKTRAAPTGHPNDVYFLEAVAGGLLVSADRDGTVRLWSTSTCKVLEHFRVEGRVAAAWLELGKLQIAVKTPDGAVFVHALHHGDQSALTGNGVGEAKGRDVGIDSVCVSADGALGLAASENSITVWDAHEVKMLRQSKSGNRLNCIALSGNGAVACAATREGALLVLDPASGSCVAKHEIKNERPRGLSASEPFMVQRGDLLAVGLSASGDIAIVGTEDRSAILWNLSAGSAIGQLAGHQYPVGAAAISADGKWCLTGSGNTLRIFRPPNESPLHTITERTHITSVSMSRQGDVGLSAVGKAINIWSIREGRKLGTLSGHSGRVSGVSLDPAGGFAVSCSEDRTLRLWSLSDMSCLGLFNVTAHLTCCACNVSRGRIIAGDSTGRVYFLQYVAGSRSGAAD